MPYTNPGLKAMADGIAAAGTRISFHTADPGTTGAAEVTGTGRPATTWATGTDGTRVGSKVSAPIAAGTTITHWGLFSAATGGTFLYGGPLPAPETFGSSGTQEHTPTLTVTNP